MVSGLLVVLVIPAILALLFAAWVMVSIVSDVSKRNESSFEANPNGVIRQVIPS